MPASGPPIRWACGCSCTIARRRWPRPGRIEWLSTCMPDGPGDEELAAAESLAQHGAVAEGDASPALDEPEIEDSRRDTALAVGTQLRWRLGRAAQTDLGPPLDGPPPRPAPEPLPKRRCSECDQPFTPTRRDHAVCGPPCAIARRQRLQRERYRTDESYRAKKNRHAWGRRKEKAAGA